MGHEDIFKILKYLPLGIRFRAVPLISKEYDMDTQDKIKILMQRQEHFQDSITSTFYLHVSNMLRHRYTIQTNR